MEIFCKNNLEVKVRSVALALDMLLSRHVVVMLLLALALDML